VEHHKTLYEEFKKNKPRCIPKNVASESKTRREWARKRNLQKVNEHFECLSNAVMPSAAVFH